MGRHIMHVAGHPGTLGTGSKLSFFPGPEYQGLVVLTSYQEGMLAGTGSVGEEDGHGQHQLIGNKDHQETLQHFGRAGKQTLLKEETCAGYLALNRYVLESTVSVISRSP